MNLNPDNIVGVLVILSCLGFLARVVLAVEEEEELKKQNKEDE